MNRIDDYLLRLLLECLTTQESSIKEFEKKLIGLEELVLMNNQLLGFLAKISLPTEEYLENSEMQLKEELLEELIKHSVDQEKWGKA